MFKLESRQLVCVAAALVLPLLLAGCGGSGSKATPGEKIFKGIYTNASDCADSGKINFEQCSEIIAGAVAKHEADAPTYTELRFCEKKEGDGKCEFTANNKIRPKLLAFLVTMAQPPTAVSLYAHPRGEDGFRDLGGTLYMHTSEELAFSEHAVSLYEKLGKKKRR